MEEILLAKVAEASSRPEEILSAKGITKSFPGVRALDHVDFNCVEGEVHALVGENGAGKSTLMKILAGAQAPDEGELIIKGEKVAELSPQVARGLGVGIIYQELSLLPHMSVAENISLGREPMGRLGLVDRQAMERQAMAILDLLDCRLDPQTPVHRLGPAQRQLVEIAKALSFDPEILIMDEPSSSLDEHELQQLFAVIRSLRERGVTIIYISHRLEEIFSIADRVTVLKDGKVAGTLPIFEANRALLIRMMVGRDLKPITSRNGTEPDEVLLEVRALNRPGVLHNVSLVLRRGEILGVAGLIGSGRTELARAIFAADPIQSGSVLLRGRQLSLSGPRQAIREGIGLIPEDRKAEGLLLAHSVRENIALPSLPTRRRAGFINGKAERAVADQAVQQLTIHTPTIEQQVAYLSGGNQQKVVLAKWLICGPEVLIFDEPTRGIDVGGKTEIYALLRRLADSGKAIMVISSELPEVLQLSDRILVMAGGRVAGELKAEEATEEKVMELAYKEHRAGPARSSPDGDALIGAAPPAQGAKGESANAWAEAAEQGAAERPRPQWQRVGLRALGLLSRVDWTSSAVYIMLALLLVAGVLGSDRFLTGPNLANLLRQATVPLLLGIGQAMVILSGGIDLSVSSVVTMVTVFTAGLMAGSDLLLLPVALLCLGIGLAVGAANAFSVVWLRVPAIIATLGMMTIGQGVALIYTREPIGIIPRSLGAFAQGSIGPVPTPLFLIALVLAGTMVLLYKSRYGRHLYAVGGDEEVARLSGIRVERVRSIAYLVSGLLAALSGLYLMGRMGSGDPSVGPGLELDSIAAALLGGMVLGGGRGGLVGTVAGVLVLVVLSNVFNQLGVNAWYQQIAKGLIIVFAVTIYKQRG